MRDKAFEELWTPAPKDATARFDPSQIAGLPDAAQRYLKHALAPGCLVASAVRLSMHGEIKQQGAWHPFEAEQVIRWGRGFVWRARATLKGLPVSGSDRWIDGEGSMRWKAFGLIPVMTAEGPDISRAALGRVQIESMWLPSVLLPPDVVWNASDAAHLGVDLHLADHAAHLDLSIEPDGRVRTACIARWGDPAWAEGAPHDYSEVPFGCIATAEKTFDGITIPTAMRVGWYFGSDRFETEGEFFRVTVEHAEFR